jgi:hypothetical protein
MSEREFVWKPDSSMINIPGRHKSKLRRGGKQPSGNDGFDSRIVFRFCVDVEKIRLDLTEGMKQLRVNKAVKPISKQESACMKPGGFTCFPFRGNDPAMFLPAVRNKQMNFKLLFLCQLSVKEASSGLDRAVIDNQDADVRRQ